MPKPRFSGGSTSSRSSLSQIAPADSGISPAMQFSAVDLPQPDGPSSAMNSPRLTVIERSFSAGGDHRLGLERLFVWELAQPLVVLRPAELLDHVLAGLRRHPQRHALHRRTG